MSARVYLFPDPRRVLTPTQETGGAGGGAGADPSHIRAAAEPAGAGPDLVILLEGGVHHGRHYQVPRVRLSCGERGSFSA
jgi:hypothetical protein